ncbi:unnamed protein product, partial [Protopolystoma xenopodis]
MAKLTDDADYEAGETFENVSSPLSDAGNHDNYYGAFYIVALTTRPNCDNEVNPLLRTYHLSLSLSLNPTSYRPSTYSHNSVRSFPPTSPLSVSLRVRSVKRTHLHHRYQKQFSTQAIRESVADSSLFQPPLHQVSLKEHVHSLLDPPLSGVFPISGQSFRCIPVNCVA